MALIANLNRGFDQVLADVKLLRALGLFQYKGPSPFDETCRLTIEELRGWANFELTGALYETAEEDWTRYGRLRLRWESPRWVETTCQWTTGGAEGATLLSVNGRPR